MTKEVFICRAPRRADNFTHLPNELLQSRAISPECLGVLVHLLSRPPTWKVKPEVLAEHYGCSKDRIYRILKDLQSAGFVVRRSMRDEKKITHWKYWVFDEPQLLTENPEVGAEDLLPGFPEEVNSGNGKNPTPIKDRDSKKDRDSRPAKQDAPYSEEFEALWQQYPRTRNTSKKKAWDLYRMLNEENQQRVRAAVPAFAAAMRAEGRPEDKIKHFQSFLSERIYETVAPPAPAAGAPAGPARPFWETATRKDWVSALTQWSYNWNWKKMWGPEPENPLRPNPAGAPKHHVPQDILDRFDLKYRGHLYSHEELAAIKARVEAAEASKHAVDKERAA